MQDASTLVLPSEAPAPVPVPAGRDSGHKGEGDRDDGGGAATYPVAADATTMQHVRTAIDDLDRKIVSLLGWFPRLLTLYTPSNNSLSN